MTNKSVLMKLVIVALFMQFWDHITLPAIPFAIIEKGVKDNSGRSLWSSKERPYEKSSIGPDAC